MATTKIWPIRDNLSRVLDYAENHLKTANPNAYSQKELSDLREVLQYAANDSKTAQQFYVTGVNCISEIAYDQMMATKQRYGKTGGNLAYHAYQSFAPDEVTPEQCHKIGVELARRIWGDKYEVLVTTHLNTHCVHNHFVVNSVAFTDGKKLNNNYAMYFKNLRAESDRICAEHGLSVIETPGRSGSKNLQDAEKRGEPTMWNVIRSDIDSAIKQTVTNTQFYGLMRKWGYSFDFNPKRKYPTLRAPDMKQRLRFKTLGESYTPEVITKRILANRPLSVQQPKPRVQYYRLRGSFRQITPASSGLHIMYLLFTLILRRIANRNTAAPTQSRRIYTPEIREAVRRLDKYSQQTQLLCRHKLKTPEQVKVFIGERNQQRTTLERERVRVYNRMKKADTPEKLAGFKSERDDLSKQIKVIRKELFLANSVLTEREEIRRKLQAQRGLGKQYLEKDKPKTKQNLQRKVNR